MLKRLMLSGCALALMTHVAPAKVVINGGADGFAIEHVAAINAPPAQVWHALLEPGSWWSPEHTYSSDAHNLTLNAKAGGCWCEKLPGGSVEHMRVIYIDRDKVLRLQGGLGPLQTIATGVLTFALAPAGSGTKLDVTYRVWGYDPAGLGATWSSPVDQVVGEQVARLKSLIETGKPAP
jgi:uncharacterized protein YndB with AHSA1/START domain